ncbi:g3145 [Coccomyxa viridis]|uniref:G3145 protein n=1 Tax=Coccomyxa viridis TaxID=1274662 RepID=A0ABP1FU00_9CHLO
MSFPIEKRQDGNEEQRGYPNGVHALAMLAAQTAAQSQDSVPPSAPPSAGADLSQFIDDNPGGERHRRLLLTGAPMKLPSTQHLAVAVHGTFPWLWPWAEACEGAGTPGPGSAPDNKEGSAEHAIASVI